MAYDVSDFQTEVLESSYKSPVLVDFWAPWCGPCRILGPVLEKLATENAGRWKLAKVNTDEQPAISMQYGIRGIPAVKLFVDGQVVNEFTGALPEHAVRRWLEEALPSQEKVQLEAAEAALEAGQYEMAAGVLRGLLASNPTHARARVLLARVLAQTDLPEATRLIEGIEVEPGLLPLLESIRTLGRLVDRDPASFPDEPGRTMYLSAREYLLQGNWDQALARFIDGIQQHRYYDDDGARKACIALFSLLGPTHEVTRKHRRMFDMVLY